MKSCFGRALLTGASMIALMVAAPSLVAAADADPAAAPSDGVSVAEIVVTAQKREENVNKVGLSITALRGAELKERSIQSVADIAQVVPGLSYTNSANNTPVYTLRGVGFYDTSLGSYPTTSVYVDQVPLPFPVLTALTAFDLERIEVLKGPQGTLFGQNSTGGAINYIAAKPTNQFSAGADIAFGRFDTFTGDMFVSGPIKQDLKARFALRYENGGPWQQSYTRNDTNGRTDQLAARAIVDWQASSALKFELNVNGWEDRSQPEAVQYIAFNQQAISNTPPVLAYPTAPANARAADWSADNGLFGDRKMGQVSLRADDQLSSDITLTSITSYLHFAERGAMDQDGVNLADIDLPFYSGKIGSVYQELRLANNAADRFRWIVGGNYSHDTVYYDENLQYGNSSAFFNDGIDTSQNYSKQSMNNYAGFASGEFDIMPTLTVLGGLRYTQADRSAAICNHDGGDGKTAAFFTFLEDLLSGTNHPALTNSDCFALGPNFVAGYTPFQGTLNQHNVSWRTGLNYRPTKTLLIYATVSRGYKAGEFGNINAATESQYVPAVQESILSYEGGFKAQLFEHRLSVDAAGFYMSYDNKQLRSKVIDPVFGIVDEIINIPRSHIDGFEVNLDAAPARGLSIGADITYIASRIDQYTGVNAGGEAANFAGTPVPFTPKWQGGINGRYEHPLSDALTGFVASQLTYRDSTNAIVGGAPFYDIGSYAVVDAQVGIESSHGWKAMIWGKNLTNKYYWTNVVAGQDTIVRYAAMPLTFGGTLSYVF